MALVHESTTTPDRDYGAGITFSMPSTRPDGDLYIVCIAKDDDQTVTHTGWTEIDIQSNGGTWSTAAYYRVGSSEPSTYDFTWTGNETAIATVLRFSGSTNLPVGNGSNANSSTMTCPALTTTPDSASIIVRVFGIEDDNPGSNPPADHTEVAQDYYDVGGQGVFFSVCTDDTLGATDAASYGGTYSDNWGAISIEVPAGAGNVDDDLIAGSLTYAGTVMGANTGADLVAGALGYAGQIFTAGSAADLIAGTLTYTGQLFTGGKADEIVTGSISLTGTVFDAAVGAAMVVGAVSYTGDILTADAGAEIVPGTIIYLGDTFTSQTGRQDTIVPGELNYEGGVWTITVDVKRSVSSTSPYRGFGRMR